MTLLVSCAIGCALIVVALVLWRRHALGRRVGSFTCMWCPVGGDFGARVPGIAHFSTGGLEWHRTVSLAHRPALTWSREELDLVDRRTLTEVDERGRAMVEVDCRHRGTAFVLIMSTAAYSGLVSWLESRPHSVGAL